MIIEIEKLLFLDNFNNITKFIEGKNKLKTNKGTFNLKKDSILIIMQSCEEFLLKEKDLKIEEFLNKHDFKLLIHNGYWWVNDNNKNSKRIMDILKGKNELKTIKNNTIEDIKDTKEDIEK